MNVRRLLPVLVATCAIALTPVFAYADALPKNEKALSDAAATKVVEQALAFAQNQARVAGDADSQGNLVSSVAAARYWDSFLQKLVDLKLVSSADSLNKGQIMRVIAQSNRDKEANTSTSGDEERSTGSGQETNKGKHNGATADEDKDEADSEDDEAATAGEQGKSEANKHRGQTEAETRGNSTR